MCGVHYCNLHLIVHKKLRNYTTFRTDTAAMYDVLFEALHQGFADLSLFLQNMHMMGTT